MRLTVNVASSDLAARLGGWVGLSWLALIPLTIIALVAQNRSASRMSIHKRR